MSSLQNKAAPIQSFLDYPGKTNSSQEVSVVQCDCCASRLCAYHAPRVLAVNTSENKLQQSNSMERKVPPQTNYSNGDKENMTCTALPNCICTSCKTRKINPVEHRQGTFKRKAESSSSGNGVLPAASQPVASTGQGAQVPQTVNNCLPGSYFGFASSQGGQSNAGKLPELVSWPKIFTLNYYIVKPNSYKSINKTSIIYHNSYKCFKSNHADVNAGIRSEE